MMPNSQKKTIKTVADLICPHCGFKQQVQMPESGCQYLYRCQSCQQIIKAKPGDCCVFCSYADIQCPPKQMGL